MTRTEMIELIKASITVSYSIPYLIKEEEITRVMTMELRTIYRDYVDAIQDQMIIIPVDKFQSPEFRNNRTLQLPSCVMGIERVIEINGGNNLLGINDPDMRFNKMMTTDLFLSPFSTDQLGYRIINWSMWDQAKAFMLQDIQHDFNINTKRLIIKGRTPSRHVLVRAKTQIEEEALYEDPIVQRWLIAECKKSLGRIFKAFNVTLIGGVTINADMWMEEGKSEMEAIKTEINDLNQPCYMIMVN